MLLAYQVERVVKIAYKIVYLSIYTIYPPFACHVCLHNRYVLMMKCWRADPQERPQFAELVKTIEDMLGVGMDYLDLGCLVGVSNREYFMSNATDDDLPKGLSKLFLFVSFP